MKIADDCICQVCKKVFCCSKCREQHHIKNHAIVVRISKDETENLMHLFCPICEKKPLLLHSEMYDEILEHIKNQHLPLHCQKCSKTYNKVEDLREFSLCTPSSGMDGKYECYVTDQSCDTVKGVTQTSISTQTSPMRNMNDSHVTPISLLNIRWKARNKVTQEEFISDSVSSIRNISSISNSSIKRSIGVTTNAKGKLVRSTSTPVQGEFCVKPKEQTFNQSNSQVSSIHSSGFEADTTSLPQHISGSASAKQALEVNRCRKVGGRSKMPAVTPLRQVMSKSIQKAFVKHGPPVNSGMIAPISSPLDLRLSPAIRRTKSEISYSTNSDVEFYLASNTPSLQFASQKLRTESIVITRTQHLSNVESTSSTSSDNSASIKLKCIADTEDSLPTTNNVSVSNSVYKTCRSVEIITSTEVSEINLKQESLCVGQRIVGGIDHLASITPITRIPGAAINKKVIKFETPNVELEQTSVTNSNVSSDEKFFTPASTPMRQSSLKSPSVDSLEEEFTNVMPRNLNHRFGALKRPALRECSKSSGFTRIENVKEEYDDDVFLSNGETDQIKDCNQQTQRTWSLSSIVNTVMRLPSLRGGHQKVRDDTKSESGASTLIKRCASIAGSLMRPKTVTGVNEQFTGLKRKRTYTAEARPSHSDIPMTSPNRETEICVTSKRFRIQGRKPIDRMRHNS